MNICVYGLWHLGTVTSACLAKLGHKVVGLDLDEGIIKGLQKNRAPVFEPGLNELIAKQVNAGRLSFSHDPKEAMKNAEILWFAFDTPVNAHDEADIGALKDDFGKIMPFLGQIKGIIISSQAPVGFTGQLEEKLLKRYPGKEFYFACSAENLKLGKALDAFLDPDRIIIGVRDQASRKFFTPLFSSISDRLEWMKIESAEMTKQAINSFLALSVCFANEIAAICESTGADAKEVEQGLRTESRIGPKAYLSPGAAFSGGTLARDVNLLAKLSRQYKLPAFIIKAVNDSNSFHQGWAERKCRLLLGSFKKKTIAILGLTYKPGTDTLRRSLALELARSMHAKGAKVIAYDPMIKSVPKQFTKIISLKKGLKDTLPEADAVIIACDCPEFKELSLDLIIELKKKIIIDPNGFIRDLVGRDNINYASVGRLPFKGDEPMKLKGRTAIITGANQGLGEAIATEFVRQGAHVMICARDKDKLWAVKRKLERICLKGQKVAAMVADISQESAVKRMINTAIRDFKQIDILVNNAGIYGPKGPIEKIDSKEWFKTLNINLGGVFYCCKHIMAHMKKNNYGKIINLSGGGATAPLAFISAYAASKAGVVRFTETLAGECNGFNIDVNALAPGALNTRLLEEVLTAGPKRVGEHYYKKALIQKKEGGVPLELGVGLCLFLASPKSDGITGRLISAKWDPWQKLTDRRQELMKSDIYTLRRIIPEDRGKKWG